MIEKCRFSAIRPYQHFAAAGIEGHHLAGFIVEDRFGIKGAGDLFEGGAGAAAYESVVENICPVYGIFDDVRMPSIIFLGEFLTAIMVGDGQRATAHGDFGEGVAGALDDAGLALGRTNHEEHVGGEFGVAQGMAGFLVGIAGFKDVAQQEQRAEVEAGHESRRRVVDGHGIGTGNHSGEGTHHAGHSDRDELPVVVHKAEDPGGLAHWLKRPIHIPHMDYALGSQAHGTGGAAQPEQFPQPGRSALNQGSGSLCQMGQFVLAIEQGQLASRATHGSGP